MLVLIFLLIVTFQFDYFVRNFKQFVQVSNFTSTLDLFDFEDSTFHFHSP